MKINYFTKPTFMKTLLSSLILLMPLEARSMESPVFCAFEGELDNHITVFLSKSAVHQEVKEDFDTIVQKPKERGTILRKKFDPSYGAADCQTQAFLMMSILHDYKDTLFDHLPLKVQTTLKVMHALTKYYTNIRDDFNLVVGEEKGIEKIVYTACEKSTSYKLIETGITTNELLKTLGVGLSQTAIANLKRHTRTDLQEEFNHPKSHPKLGLPQSLTTLGLVGILDYMKLNTIPLLLKVTRILGTGVEGKGKKQKGIFKGQKQQLMLLKPGENGQLKTIPQENWGKYEYDPVFAIRLFSIKCTFKKEQFKGYAEQLHEAESFEDYLTILDNPEFVPFLLALNAVVDDAVHGRNPVCAPLKVYFDKTLITYQPTWMAQGCNEGSVPMETPHVYLTTLHQQRQSLKNVEGIEIKKRLIKPKGEK